MKFLPLLIILTLKVTGQNFDQKILNTSVSQVTLHLTSAQIMRTGSLNLQEGSYQILIKNLSPYIDPKTIKIEAQGEVTLISVNHRPDFINREKISDKADSLKKELENTTDSIQWYEAMLSTLISRRSILAANNELSFNSNTTQLKEFIDFQTKQIYAISKEELRIKKNISLHNEVKSSLEKQINGLDPQSEKPQSEIELKIKVSSRTYAAFQIHYLCSNAGWFPKYNVRVEEVNHPIRLTYRAEIHQNTGEDWENIRLRFSNANPVATGEVPKLEKWLLDFNRFSIYQSPNYLDPANIRTVSGRVTDVSGEPIIGATLMIKGTTIGTVTDFDGGYEISVPFGRHSLQCSYTGYVTQNVEITGPSIDLTLTEGVQLDEVFVTAYGVIEKSSSLSGRVTGITTEGYQNYVRQEKSKKAEILESTVVKNQTSVEFVLDDPISLRSGGEIETIDLKDFEIPASYEYIVIPKVDQDAFLLAHIADWEQYNLLDGEANLYFENSFVGRSIIGNQFSDTLDISLGRDKNVLVQRKDIDTHSSKRMIATNATLRKSHEIRLRNQKDQSIQIKVYDQIPVAARNEIKIEVKEINNGLLDDQTGSIMWNITLSPQQTEIINLVYEVKYPRSEQITVRQ